MKHIKNVFLMLVMTGLFLGACSVVWAETAPLSFEQFYQKVLTYYPKLKAAHSDVDVALAREMQAKAGFWPSLNLSTGYKISDDPVNVFGMLLRQERFTSADFDLKRLNTPDRHQDFSLGAHVEWPLFDAMQTIDRARAARENLKAAESDEAFTKMEALLIAQDAYLNALTLDELTVIVDDVQKSSDEDLQKAKDLKDKGMILGADYYSARVMFGDFTRMKNELHRQKKAMTALLNILMGEAVDVERSLSSPLIRETTITGQDARELVDLALTHRQDLSGLELRLKASEADISRARSTGLPALSAFADATEDRNKIGSSGGNNYTVGVKAEMPLFDPSREGRVKEAVARRERLAHDIQVFKDGISRDIAEETARHEALRDNMDILKGMREDAKASVSLMAPLYSEGRKSVADLMAARRAYLQVVETHQKSLMGAWMSEARLLFLTGRLNEEAMKSLAQRSGL